MNENDKLKEKLDLLSVLKEDEENEKKQKANKKESEKKVKKEKKTKKKKEKLKKFNLENSENVLEEIKKVKESTPKKKGNKILVIFAFMSLVIALAYLIYTILKASNQIDQPYLIISSSFLFILSASLAISTFARKKACKQLFNGFSLLFITIYTLFQLLVTSNTLSLPKLKTVGDFTNESINDVIKWASDNHIALEQIYEFSDSIETNHVITQSISADTLVKNIKKMEVTVSNGPNYDTMINLPNMVGWNVDDVVKKVKEEKLNNVQIEFNFHDTIERDVEYEQSKSGQMKRNDELVLKFSLGKQSDLKPVDLIELTGKDIFDATLWLKRNGIKYEISYEFSDNIELGKVISTTPSKGANIIQSETTVVIVVSKGPKIVVPDLSKMSLDEIAKWASENKVAIVYESEYNNEIKAGKIIRVSAKKGDTIDTNAKIYITTSKGSLKMVSYQDGDITTLRNFASEYKLTLTETSDFSDTVEKGKFISISKKPGETVNTKEEIRVIISLGKEALIPNFYGMTVNKARNACNNAGIYCSFSYVYSSRTKGTIFYQNMTAGSKVIQNTNVVLTVSNGLRPNNTVSNSSGSNSSSGNSSSSSTSNRPSGGGNTQTPTPNCISYTLRLGAGSSVEQTKNIIKNSNPNGKFKFVTVNPGYGSTGSLTREMASTLQGTTHTSCETVTIYIIDTSK